MAVTLSPEHQKVAIASITRFCLEDLEVELSDVQARLLLKFVLAEIGPSAYNAGVNDAQVFLRDRLGDLEATCYEAEFAYWPKTPSIRRKT